MARSLRALAGGAGVLVFAVLAGACGGASRPPSDGLTDIGAGLRGPAGLTATEFTSGIPNVAAIAFDSQGRLWAASASFQDTGTDALYLVPSEGGRPLLVTGDLHTVLGLLWHKDELYVASKERVEAYGGFDGLRFGGARVVVQFPAGVGEVNGLTLSPEGRLVLGISAPCNACDPALAMSGALVSFLPDGSGLRTEATGIRAPIGLAYVPGTGDLLVTMNQRDDLGDATPGDWLALVTAGQDWGFPYCYGQADEACSGLPQPIAELDKHAAVSGMALPGGALAAKLGLTAVVAEWATGKVMSVSLQKSGAGYSGSVATFLTGFENPVPVALDPAGGLVVGDWGTGVIFRVQ